MSLMAWVLEFCEQWKESILRNNSGLKHMHRGGGEGGERAQNLVIKEVV